jgi:hypothetical protein
MYVYAVSSGANEPIADNELGLTAKDCALQYCTEKDGMSLWLSLVNQCVSNPNPYFRQKTTRENYEEVVKTDEFIITPLISGSVCAAMSLISFMLGYSYYRYDKIKNGYQKVNMREEN